MIYASKKFQDLLGSSRRILDEETLDLIAMMPLEGDLPTLKDLEKDKSWFEFIEV